jgi:two-component system, NtrC family, response regulator AtoC
MSREILIVDDDRDIASIMARALQDEGYKTHSCFGGAEALKFLKTSQPDLIFLDLRLPEFGGKELLRRIMDLPQHGGVIMVTAFATISLTVECLKMGAYDFIEKPFELEELTVRARNYFEGLRLKEKILVLEQELQEIYPFEKIIGTSGAIRKVFRFMEVAAKSNINVLITGESGTGKELIARAIHDHSLQMKQPFVPVNCVAIPDTLIESELFGHEKGAFTGAIDRKIGKFEKAESGTIFLDEIGDLSGPIQGKMLRALQEREIERVGGNEPIRVKARFISATNKNLESLVRERKFREDLFFRINVMRIQTPALRERREDIPALVSYFLKKKTKPKSEIEINKQAMDQLLHHDWPGNVRELENVIERILAFKGQRGRCVITEKDVVSLGFQVEEGRHAGIQTLDDAEKMMIENALKKTVGNISQASKLVRVSRDTFYRKMKRYGIHVSETV